MNQSENEQKKVFADTLGLSDNFISKILAQAFANVMNGTGQILSKNWNIRTLLKDQGNVSAKTNNKKIFLGYDQVFDSDNIPMFTGLFYHELGHIMFSPSVKTIYEEIQNQRTDFSRSSSRIKKTWNALEDCRIENLLSAKYHIRHFLLEPFKELIIKNKEMSKVQGSWFPVYFQSTYGRMHLPSTVRNTLYNLLTNEEKRLFEDKKFLIDDYINLKNDDVEGMIRISIIVEEMFKNHNEVATIADNTDNSNPLKRSQELSQDEFDDMLKETKENDEDPDWDDNDEDEDEDPEDDPEDNGGPGVEHINKNETKDRDDLDDNDLIDRIDQEIENNEEDITKSKKDIQSQMNEEIEKHNLFDTSDTGYDRKVTFEMKNIITRLAKQFEKFKWELKGGFKKNQTSGSLDLNRAFVTQRQKSTKIFRQYKPDQRSDALTDVFFALDLSVSMKGSKIREACKGLHILQASHIKAGNNVTAYGFANSDQSYFLRDKKTLKKDIYREYKTLGGTNPLRVYDMIIAKVSKSTKKNKVVIILSDGQFTSNHLQDIKYRNNVLQREGCGVILINYGHKQKVDLGYDLEFEITYSDINNGNTEKKFGDLALMISQTVFKKIKKMV